MVYARLLFGAYIPNFSLLPIIALAFLGRLDTCGEPARQQRIRKILLPVLILLILGGGALFGTAMLGLVGGPIEAVQAK